MNDLERQTEDFRRQAREMLAAHRPKGVEGMDELDYADLAAELDWPVDTCVPFLIEHWDHHDEASARELLVSARMVKLDRDLEREDET